MTNALVEIHDYNGILTLSHPECPDNRDELRTRFTAFLENLYLINPLELSWTKEYIKDEYVKWCESIGFKIGPFTDNSSGEIYVINLKCGTGELGLQLFVAKRKTKPAFTIKEGAVFVPEKE